MRPAGTPYPVDRYLVESRKKIDMVNIIDDDIWNLEPTLRPEDEIILRKLHDMLQSTADDLKMLSGELSKYHEPGVQVKAMPIPLDDEFNEKIHIEEVVNAKFHGYKLVDDAQRLHNKSQKHVVDSILKSLNDNNNRINSINISEQEKNLQIPKKQTLKKKLQISRIKTIEINGQSSSKNQTDNNSNLNIVNQRKNHVPAVSYNEFSYKYVDTDIKKSPRKSLQIQEMPSINIRSDLRTQKVLQLDILPENKKTHAEESVQHNALVIEMQHEPLLKQKDTNSINYNENQYKTKSTKNKPISRKISTMSAYESTESSNISSDSQPKLNKQKPKVTVFRKSPILEKKIVQNTKNNNINKKITSRSHVYLDEWKKKLNAVYGRPINYKSHESKKKKVSSKNSVQINTEKKERKRKSNITEYIPYSKLTLGGVNVSDIEREISHIPNKNNIVLSPILDKILSSRENSFHKDSPKKTCQNKNSKILTTSDENLLQEVLDLEMKVTNTLSNKNIKNTAGTAINDGVNDSFKDLDSYADDFEDEKTEASENEKQNKSNTSKSSQNLSPGNSQEENMNEEEKIGSKKDIHKNTSTKVPNLSFKNTVDIFEFVHSVDTQETGTQSNTINRITLKETQTSPRDNRPNVEPIHNELWPPIDPRGEVTKMLELEKEFIKKLIIDEYGDLLEKKFEKPSLSNQIQNKTRDKNAAATQKNTQTSPPHVKSVMTSPTRTITRTTSPFVLTLNQQTSPIFIVSNEEELKVEIENDDLGISANLSSPRFNLRLPPTSHEVISKFDINVQKNIHTRKYDNLKNFFSSSSSADAEYSSSDISSLGEIGKKFKRFRKSRIPSISEISSSSSLSKCSLDLSGAIIPLRSEGEASVGQINKKKGNKPIKSEEEMSLGQLR